MKKIATTVLFFIIALSSTGCGQKNVIGTYCTGEGLSREDVYVSLLSDNTFLIYRQLETGLPGKFDSAEFENFTVLTFQLEEGRQLSAAYDKQNSLVFVGEFINDISCPIEFKRISSTPISINVYDIP